MTSKSKDLLADLKVAAPDAAVEEAPKASAEPASAVAGPKSKRRERSGKEGEEPTDAPQEEPPLPAAPLPRKDQKVYEVAELTTRRVSWGGQDIRLKPGQRVSDERLGPNAVQRLLDAGVLLREVTD